MNRIACIYIPMFPLAARLRSEPELLQEALAIVEGNGNNAETFWNIVEKGAQEAADKEDVELVFRRPPTGSAAEQKEIIDTMLDAVASDLPYESGDNVALMINGLGGTPISELYILYGRAHQQLEARGIHVRKNYVGEYCTSLDMAGCSVTV